MILRDIISVFRPSRWYRNSFMLLGAILALGITENSLIERSYEILIAFIALCLVTSGNYGVNEICDIETDRAHPQKKHRSLASGRVSIGLISVLSLLLYIASILIIFSLDKLPLSFSLILLLITGILYNVRPFRLKDYAYLDFLFEALNNPIRLAVGWFAVVNGSQIPSSFLFGFYAIGVFLMASKRFGELRLFEAAEQDGSQYRLSLRHYSEKNLLFSMIAAISTFSFLFGILSYKYNINLVLMLPFFIGWVIWFFELAYEDNSIVKDPERIYEKKSFLVFSLTLVILFIWLLFSDTSFVSILTSKVEG